MNSFEISDSQLEKPKANLGSTISISSGISSARNIVSTIKQTLSKFWKPSVEDVSELNDLKVWVGTWNMHGEPPPDELEPLIRRPKDSDSVEYHILAIGTQECERSIEKSVIYPSKGIWEQKLKSILSPYYVMLKSETLAAIHLCIFVSTTIKDLISGKLNPN
jgi:hypothetical protein